MTKRINFSDSSKAKIFKRDHGVCSFTGKSLWIIDYGADPNYDIDWVDHIVPASKGGGNNLENGALSGWYSNFNYRDNDDKKYICKSGKIISKTGLSKIKINEIQSNLNRFTALVESDWYLNRALWHVWMAGCIDWEIKKGYKRSRDKDYWLSSANVKFEKWKRLSNNAGIDDVYQRGLVPEKLRDDQSELIKSINNASSIKKFIKMLQYNLELAEKIG